MTNRLLIITNYKQFELKCDVNISNNIKKFGRHFVV